MSHRTIEEGLLPYRTNLSGLIAVLAIWPLAGALAQQSQDAQDGAETRLILQESASREVEQNVLVAVLEAHGEAQSAREAQASVNQAMVAAVEQARAVAGVRPASGGYRVYQQRDRDGNPVAWIAEQDLRLTSEDSAALLELVGRLQEAGLNLNGLSWHIDEATRRKVQDELTIEAIATLRRRAEAIAASVGMQVGNIDTLRVGAVMEGPQPMMAMRAEMADMAPPTALPDLETVSASVEAEITLSAQ